MLKNLPIILSQTSQNFYLLLFILIVPPIIPFLFYSVNDNITMQECIYYLLCLLTALIEYLTVLLGYLDLFAN